MRVQGVQLVITEVELFEPDQVSNAIWKLHDAIHADVQQA